MWLTKILNYDNLLAVNLMFFESVWIMEERMQGMVLCYLSNHNPNPNLIWTQTQVKNGLIKNDSRLSWNMQLIQ